VTPVAITASGGLAALAAWAPIYYATYAVRSQWLGPTVWHGPRNRASIALTFDDGPGQDTERVLDVLARHSVRATFFMIGRHVERHPQIARRIVADGHEIGNHSYAHPIYLYVTPSRTRRELERTQHVLRDVVGVTPSLSRPPCGVRTPAYFSAARALRLRTIQWSVAGYDWRPVTSTQITAAVLRGLEPGAIVLLHDADSAGRGTRKPTAEAVTAILRHTSARGLRSEPLSQLLRTDASTIASTSHV